jgi:hypothetical protein
MEIQYCTARLLELLGEPEAIYDMGCREAGCQKYGWMVQGLTRRFDQDWWFVQRIIVVQLIGGLTLRIVTCCDHVGSRILTSHKSTLSRLLHAVFPEHEWCEWKFERIRRGFWNDVENHKKYMDWAGRELNVKSLDDWYSITPENFGRLEGTIR